jgi:hypothetical protein
VDTVVKKSDYVFLVTVTQGGQSVTYEVVLSEDRT